MKKIFSLLLFAVLTLSLAVLMTSCDNKNNEPHTHTFGEWSVVTAATCTAEGLEQRVCSDSECGHVESRPVAATGHTLTLNEGFDVSCNEDGWAPYETCSKCSYTTFELIKALGCEYNNGICIRCSQRHVHTFGEWYGNTATCTEEGVEYKDCTGCDVIETRETGLADHTYDEEKICVNCGDYEDDHTLPGDKLD